MWTAKLSSSELHAFPVIIEPTSQFNPLMDEERFLKTIYDALGGTAKQFTHRRRVNGKQERCLKLPWLRECRRRFALKLKDPEWFDELEEKDT